MTKRIIISQDYDGCYSIFAEGGVEAELRKIKISLKLVIFRLKVVFSAFSLGQNLLINGMELFLWMAPLILLISFFARFKLSLNLFFH